MLENPPKKMPQPLRKMYAHFVGYYIAALELRSTYRDLYLKPSSGALLSNAELIRFALELRAWMIQQQFIGIARMIDPPENRAQKNLSLAALVNAIPDSEVKLRALLQSRASKIKEMGKGITRHRHKHIAHFDQDFAMRRRKLRTIKHKKIDTILAAIGRVLYRIHRRYEGSSMDYMPRSLARPFLVRLAKAEAYDELERTRLIPWNSWHSKMPSL